MLDTVNERETKRQTEQTSITMMRYVLICLLLCTLACAEQPQPVGIVDMLEALVGEGMSGLRGEVHSSATSFARAPNGDIIAQIALPPHEGAERHVTAALQRDGAALQIHASVHGSHGAHRTSVVAQLPARAVRVRAATFDKEGNARVVLAAAPGADVTALREASGAEVDGGTDGGTGDGTPVSPSTFALWRAGLMGALTALACLAILRARRVVKKGCEKSVLPLTAVLSQRTANVEGEDVVLYEARRKAAAVAAADGAPVRRDKTDEKVS